MSVFVEVPYGAIFAVSWTKTRLVSVASNRSFHCKHRPYWTYFTNDASSLGVGSYDRVYTVLLLSHDAYSRLTGDDRVTHWSFWEKSPRLRPQVSENPSENNIHLLSFHWILLVAYCYRNRDKLWLCGPLAWRRLFYSQRFCSVVISRP